MYIIHKRHRKGINPYAYTDESVTVLTEDRMRVRATPKIYLPNTDLEGAVHLADEVIANAIDEVCAPGSGGDEVIITFDEKTKIISVQDNGRGFPFNKIFDMCEVLHSTAKTDDNKKAYSTSGGVHGMGLKLVNFLSEYMTIKSEREGKYIEIKYVDGIRTKVTEGKSKDHGTYVEWQVSKRFFSTIDILVEHLLEMITLKSYVTPNAKIIFQAITKNGSSVIKEFKNYSFKDFMKKHNVTTPYVEVDDMFGSEIVKATFGYDAEMVEGSHFAAFTNNIYNKLGGSHVDGLTESITVFFRKYLMETYLTERDKKYFADKDIKVRAEDCRIGLISIISVNVEKPSFRGGQHKAILDMNNIKNLMFRATRKALNALDKSKLNKIAAVIHNNIKARIALEDTKKTVKKDIVNVFSDDKIQEYEPISKRSNSDYAELFIIEGKSAKGAMESVRDPNSQALLAIRGKIENVFDLPPHEAIKSSEFLQNLQAILGSGIGPSFDINKCPFDRIYFATDADTDGNEIACQEAMTFFRFFYPLIEAGRVYRVVPPLYEIEKDGKRMFVPTSRQFMSMTQENFIKKHNVYLNGKKMDKDEVLELLINNERYIEYITSMANQHAISIPLCEFLLKHKDEDFRNSNINKWKKLIKSTFKFLNVEEGDKYITIRGMTDNEFNKFDDAEDFVKDANRFVIHNDLVGYTIDNPSDKSLTLFELLTVFEKYQPRLIHRFKGLGEMDSEDMQRTIIPRKTRHSIRLTVSDVKDTYEKLAVMHSRKVNYMKLRKEFMADAKFDIMELDT